jgi:hypothetical protein
MAGPDQFIKDLFRDETAPATGNRVHFEVPAEVATRSLTPDGRFTRAVASSELASLPPPLCHLRGEAIVDFKMPGDHVDRAALARADLRRGARWVASSKRRRDPVPPTPPPCWIRAPMRRGWSARTGPGGSRPTSSAAC